MILEQHVAVAGMDLIMKTSEMFPKKGFNGPSFEDVNTAALNAYPSLLQSWFPAGRVQGHEFVVGNVSGDKGRSLSVNTSTGVWSDFGNAGDGGSDPVSLYAAHHQIGQGEACKRLAGDLGLSANEDRTPAREAHAPKVQPRPEWKPILPAPSPPPHHPHHSRLGQPSQVWQYNNRDGQLLFLVCRFDNGDGGKDILPLSYGVLDGKEAWHWKAIPDQRPLYGLDRLQASPKAKVLVVEGEKTADAAQRLLPSLVAITWPGGGKAAGKADWSPLNSREVLIWPDADKPGRETAEGWHTPNGEFKWGLAHYLNDVGATVRVVEPPPNVKDGWDLADAELDGWDIERVVKWIRENMREASQPSGPIPATLIGTAPPPAEQAWKDTKPLPPALPTAPTMPESLIPPVLAPWLCDICERTQIPLDFVATPAIVAMSSVIGRTIGIYPKQYDDWLCVPNLWGVVIGRPGVLKSPALAEALKPLRRLAFQAQEDHKEDSRAAEAAGVVVQAQIDAAKSDARSAAKNSDQAKLTMAQSDLAQLAEKLDGLAVHEKRYIVNDGTVEKLGELLNHNPRGLLLVRDELVGLLRSLDKPGHENDRAFYLESWAGAGAFTYDRIGRGTLHIPALTLSIIGGMVPGKLKTYVNSALAGGIDDDGLLQRFQLIVWPELSEEFDNIDRFPSTEAKNAAFEAYKRLDELSPENLGAEIIDDQPPGLRFAPDAQELFNEFRDRLERRVRSSDETAPSFESHMAKYRSLVPSLALVFHLIDVVGGQSQGPVNLEATRLAAQWCDYLEQHARKVYAAELYPNLSAAHLLAEKIRIGAVVDEMNVRDIYRHHWSGLAEPEAVWDGIQFLECHNMIRIAQEETGGRPTDVIRIHPSIKRIAS